MRELTIVTATHDRVDLLTRLYENIVDQAVHERICWIVVNDGSSDGTASHVERWSAEAPFPVVLLDQSNTGKLGALLAGFARVETPYTAIMDDDDIYTPSALTEMLAEVKQLPATFANVDGRCRDQAGNLIGSPLPRPRLDADSFTIRSYYGVSGDTIGIYRTGVLAALPVEAETDRYTTEGLIFNRVAAVHPTRYVDNVWGVKEYLPGGLTAHQQTAAKRRQWYPSMFQVYSEILAADRPMSYSFRLKAQVNYLRYGMHLSVPGPERRRFAPATLYPAVWLAARGLVQRDVRGAGVSGLLGRRG